MAALCSVLWPLAVSSVVTSLLQPSPCSPHFLLCLVAQACYAGPELDLLWRNSFFPSTFALPRLIWGQTTCLHTVSPCFLPDLQVCRPQRAQQDTHKAGGGVPLTPFLCRISSLEKKCLNNLRRLHFALSGVTPSGVFNA